MKLSEYRREYQWFSGKLSDVARQLAFAGIALIWVFKEDVSPVPRVPEGLLLPAALLAIGLLFDLMHYAVATLVWGGFHRWHEKQRTTANPDPDVEAPAYINVPAIALFWLKVAAIAAALAWISWYASSVWWAPAP